jgi:hypothetical protein
MNSSFSFSDKFNLLNNTLYFFKKHFVTIIGLGFIAGLGRVIQLGGFGQITQGINILLEVVVESARLSLILYVLGLANIRNGILHIKHLLTNKQNRKSLWLSSIKNLKTQWLLVLRNLIGFLLIAWFMNYLIDLLAYETCLYLTLKKDGVLVESSSEWTVLLFFKNLSVIPFTLIFDSFLLLWLSNRVINYRKMCVE